MERGLRVIDKISHWSGVVASWLLIALVGCMFYEVVVRYAFNAPTLWSFELSMFLAGSMYALGGAYVLLNGAHIKVDVIWERFSERGKAIADLATTVFFFAFVVILLWKSWEGLLLALKPPLERTMTPWAGLLWPARMAIPVGVFLILLQGVAKLIRDFRTAITGGREAS